MRLQLAGQEADGHHSFASGGLEQAQPRPIARGVVLEVDLAEATQCRPDVRRVVDRQHPASVRVDICESPVG